MAVREFDGVDDNIICATGGLSGITHGTVAVLVQRRASGDFYALMGINDSGGALLGSILIWSNSNWTWYRSSTGSQGPASPLNTWALMVVRKASGTATPRYSIYNYGTASWTHVNGAASQANWTAPGVGGQIAFTDAADDNPAIRVAARAAWSNEVHWAASAAGDAAIEAAGLETALANWLAESPTALWRFNQATTAEAVADETGGGADQTSITGTTVVAGDDPPGFDFALAAEVVAADASHGHVADQPALTQVHEIAVSDASHGHTADQPAVDESGNVAPDSASHGHTAEQPALTQAHQLAADDASHGHTASEPTLDGLDIFSGDVLPDGWTAVQPANTAVTLAGLYLELGIDPGQAIASLSSGTSSPEGPLVWRSVSGAFDFAVGLAEEATNLPNQGFDLLALDDDMVGGVRLGAFCGDQSSSYRNDVGWFIFGSNAGTVLNVTGDDAMGDLYGGPGWLRLQYDGAGTYTAYASHTGLSGSWSQLAQFSDAFAPTRFALHGNASNSGADGRVQRVNRVVDLQARGTDDATNPPTVASRPTLYTEDFAGGTLPAWLTPVTANNGTVTTTTSGVELSIDEATFQSQAWLLTPTDLPPSHGLLLRYRLTSSGFVNSFWVPAVAVETTTDIAGAETPDDKWGDGTSLLMEMPAREHAADGQLLRMLRRSPIRQGETQTGSREFDGYTLMVEDGAAPVSTVGQPLTWIRIEHVGHWLQVKCWYDGDPEPETWTYQAQDHMRRGLGAAITLAQNDGVSGANTASVRFDRITIYEAVSGTDLTTADASHGHIADQPALTQVHELAVDDAAHAHTVDQPAITQVHGVAADGTMHGHTVGEPALSQVHDLASDDAAHSQAATQAAVTQVHSVTTEGASHGHVCERPALTQTHAVAADDASHAHTASQAALTQVHGLAVEDAGHVHTAGQPTLSGGQVVAPDGAIHSHTAGVPVLVQQHALTVDPAAHAQVAEQVALAQLHQLVVADATHAHTADEVTLPPTVVPAQSLTPGSVLPDLIPGATRPDLTSGAARPVLTPGR